MASYYHGIFTPLVTPIDSSGRPDLESMRRLVRFQLENGVHGLWVLGTSGEFGAFSGEERASIAQAVVDEVAGKVPVIVNVSDAGTRRAIRHAKQAEALGADAIAATSPYYYPHSQDELLEHYRALAASVSLPLFLYNIPQTVRVAIALDTAKQLAEEGVATGIKDSQNDLEWLRSLALFVGDRNLDFTIFCGTRHLIDAGILAGARGAIPSIANAFPRLCVDIYEAATTGDFPLASQLQAKIVAIESLVARVKTGSRNAATLGFLKALLHDRGIIFNPSLTAPLRPLSQEEKEELLSSTRDLL